MATIDLSTLNDSQRAVASRLDEPLFVAAGAGSGKTFTLTARLVHALSMGSAADGGRFLDSIDQALVITFTKAAALEIAERVRGALRAAGAEDPHLHEQSLLVDGAWISTIHGMCSRILKRHAVELGIDPEFRMCEGSVADALMARAMDEVLSEARHDEAYASLRAEYPLWGGTSSIAAMIESLRTEAAKNPCGFDDFAWPMEKGAGALVDRLHETFVTICSLKLTEKQRVLAEAGLAALDAWARLAPGARTAEAACQALADVKVPDIRKKDLKEFMEGVKRQYAEAVVCAQHERVQPFVPQLVALARQVDEAYARLKAERSYLDNDDLIARALEAVEEHPEVARDYAGRFRLVMIDEFQDTDAKQLRLISLLSGPDACHLTTVGDAQQAIYRFRGGDVEVFRARGRSLPEESHVRMDVNYRSDAQVLALVEKTCGDVGLIEDFLKLAGNGGRGSKLVAREADGSVPPRIRLEVATGGTAEMESAVIAAQLADRLATFHAQGQPQGSMALLLGSTGKVGLYLDALRSRGLEAVVTGGSSFSTTPEVGVVQALLHTLANPHDTESGLFRLLSSDLFRLDADDFCALGTCAQNVLDAPTKRPVEQCFVNGELALYGDSTPSARLVAAHGVLSRAFARLATWQLADVCMAVVDESGWLGRLEAQGTDGLASAANVLAAVRYVRELTVDLGLGAARAADEFDRWIKAAKLTPKNLAGDTLDAVSVMTVHGSKGLQFGVCAVAECWGKPKLCNAFSVGKVGEGTMLCAKPKNVPKNYKTQRDKLVAPTDARRCREAWEWSAYLDAVETMADADEKARLLYVALTRAEEALVVGLPIAEREGNRSDLAMGMLGAFPELDDPVAGELTFEVAPQLPVEVEVREDDGQGGTRLVRRSVDVDAGVARVVRLLRSDEKDGPWRAESAGTMAGFDGELPLAVAHVPLVGTQATVADDAPPASEPFVLPADVPAPADVHGWRPRDGVFSYSSAHEQMTLREAAASARPQIPPRAQQDAEAEGAPYTDDADKATGLGSAFHQLAQTMVQTGRDHDPERQAALERTWHLSERQRQRLTAAVARWEGSALRREALAHDHVRAEFPFFCAVASGYGSYVEGAIDLLATDEGSDHALVVDYKTGDIGLTVEEIEERHRMQANFYAWVLTSRGYRTVSCAFCCVELDDGFGGPLVVRYEFEAQGESRPRI